jgi:PilZ domain
MTQRTQDTYAAKRRYPRVRLPKGMLVAWQYGARRGVSRVATMGLGGLFIRTAEPAPIGTLVRLIFDLPGGEVRARATVRDIQNGEGMAVAFIAMDHAARARLDQMMKRLLD